jgi:inner membrane transporter RhtA
LTKKRGRSGFFQELILSNDANSMTAEAAPTSASQTGLAVLMAVSAMIVVQVGAALAQPTMLAYGPFATTWGRLAWAAIILGLFVRPSIRRYQRNDLLLTVALGATMAMMTLAFYVAIMRVPFGLVVAIEFLGPLSVAAFGFARSRRFVWPMLAISGVLLLSLNREGWTIDVLGFGFALLAGVGWGVYILLSKEIGKSFKKLDGLALSFVSAALIATPFGLYETGLTLPLGLATQTMGLAVLTPLLPYALEMMALRRLSSASFGILMSIEPGVGALAGYLILHEALSLQQLAGIALVICAGAGAVMARGSMHRSRLHAHGHRHSAAGSFDRRQSRLVQEPSPSDAEECPGRESNSDGFSRLQLRDGQLRTYMPAPPDLAELGIGGIVGSKR